MAQRVDRFGAEFPARAANIGRWQVADVVVHAENGAIERTQLKRRDRQCRDDQDQRNERAQAESMKPRSELGHSSARRKMATWPA